MHVHVFATTALLHAIQTVSSVAYIAETKFTGTDCNSFHMSIYHCNVIGHVNNIPTMQFFTGLHWNFQKYSLKIIYAIIDLVCPISL